MYKYRIRLRNRLLQRFYRPRKGQGKFLPFSVLEAFDEIDKRIEEDITPLLTELFG